MTFLLIANTEDIGDLENENSPNQYNFKCYDFSLIFITNIYVQGERYFYHKLKLFKGQMIKCEMSLISIVALVTHLLTCTMFSKMAGSGYFATMIYCFEDVRHLELKLNLSCMILKS